MEDLIIKQRELKENLIKLINEANLPAFIIKPIIKELFEQLNLLEEQQYQEIIKTKKEKIEKVDIAKPSVNKKEEKENGNT